jgi:protein-L-isoaspartate(D-aspartate) O-methyltransferase
MTTGDESAPGSAFGRSADRAADVARARLARALHDSGHTPSAAVQAAFLTVPRHLFVPELDPAAAYQDEALVIKYGEDGLPVSSSSQPAMMAIMLEQLRLRSGHRVLEIGTGTGYNAAVMAHIVGPRGVVVTVDIDADLIARAQASLAEAGYSQVRASCADGGYGDPEDAPFDRIIVTVGAWDIAPAWLNQLGPGGRLVLPLSVRGIQLSVGLERPPGHDGRAGADRWVATSAFRCGFVRMTGAFADPEPFRPLGLSPGLYVQADDGRQVDPDGLAAALGGRALDVGAGIRARSRDELADLDLWLTLTQPELTRLTLMETAASRAQVGPLLPYGGLASPTVGPGQVGEADWPVEGGLRGGHDGGADGVGGADGGSGPEGVGGPYGAGRPGAAGRSGVAGQAGSAARPGVADRPGSAGLGIGGLVGVRPPRGPLPTTASRPGLDPRAYPGEIVLRGYGPGGPALAGYLARQVSAWDQLGRPGTARLALTVWPADAELTAPEGQIILARPHVRLAAGWPPP